MRGWSLPIGKIFGLEVRMHTFFVLLLGLGILVCGKFDIAASRAIGLWLLLVAGVAIRELARCMTAAYFGLQLRNLLLLPIGGLFTHANPESSDRMAEPRVQRSLAFVGPLANLLAAFISAGLLISVAPQVSLLEQPWVTPLHLMRSFVWINLFLAVLNLVPAYPLDAGRLLRGNFSKTRNQLQATKAASGLGQALALVLVATGLGGLLFHKPMSEWLIFAGIFVFIGGHLEDQGVLFQSVVDTVRMRDVMLTEFSTLSPADTLEDALHRAVHSLQDDFPVVRGDALVGVVSRQNILQALQLDGNGYVQSVMTQAFQVAQPEDSLGSAFRRISAGRGLSLVPVMQGDRVVGIVTLQNLMHSMSLLAESRRLQGQSPRG